MSEELLVATFLCKVLARRHAVRVYMRDMLAERRSRTFRIGSRADRLDMNRATGRLSRAPADASSQPSRADGAPSGEPTRNQKRAEPARPCARPNQVLY